MHTRFYHTAFVLALCLVLMSCGPPPQTGKRPPIPSANRSRPASTSAPATTRTAARRQGHYLLLLRLMLLRNRS